ncbi:MAG: DsrE family protein [Gammaproteobacteria bacterium]|nr:DsrE family protein [Gammaproteobacteria bacterium]
MKTDTKMSQPTSKRIDESRRSLLGKLAAIGSGFLAFSFATKPVAKENDGSENAPETDELTFPGDQPAHQVVYQFNKSDEDYHQHVLFSVGALVRKYGDNVKIVVTCFGPGIHILAKKPGRPVKKEIMERVSSLEVYGVEFHACGNTMKSLKWTEKDLLPFVKVVEVGAADLMALQEQGFSYISW